VKTVMGAKSNGNPEKALNFLTPHQKWGIHSTYSDNLLMLTLSRGGIVWMSEADAKDLGIEDNDWIEVFNSNGALTARAVVSQRVPAGMTMMYHAQEHRKPAGFRDHRAARRDPQLRDPYYAEADPYDRRLCPAGLRL
jgi:nitrate reductase alpha subunit